MGVLAMTSQVLAEGPGELMEESQLTPPHPTLSPQGGEGFELSSDRLPMERTPGAIHTFDRAERAAKRMRREPTYAEAKLWKALRATDLHFRRQAPFGPYVVDFVCHRHQIGRAHV